MSRKTLIFGNGLGMALDSEFFDLDNAIGRTWEAGVLDDPQKVLITQCLPTPGAERPHGEDDMDNLQLALSACDLLNQVGMGEAHWLTAEGQQFPVAVRCFFHEVAVGFHGSPQGLPSKFSDALAAFLHKTRSHLATLNYDNLVYQPLIEREVLQGYDGALCDGLLDAGFSSENLERKYGHNFGYYMHLHGSPLFVDRDGVTIKLGQGELAVDEDTMSSHIVLTHVKHKPAVISASELLAVYWSVLLEAFQEAEEIVLVGYSGLDIHLNRVIKTSAPEIPVRIVEWEGAGAFGPQLTFWHNVLARNKIELVQLSSILSFTDWE